MSVGGKNTQRAPDDYGWDWSTPIGGYPDPVVMAELAESLRRERVAREACFVLRCVIELESGMYEHATDNGH